MSSNSLKSVYQEARQALQDGGVENADRVARDFIKRVVNIADIDLIVRSDQPLTRIRTQQIRQAVARRIKGEPPSRIFGERDFWGLPFKVTPDVLDPRPETETIVDIALRRFIGDPPARVLDLGTGTGCLIISLLSEWPEAEGVGADICRKALAVAKENAERHEMTDRLKLVHSNWGRKVKGGPFDLIVSNPPYISNQEIATLPPEVKNFDPILALQGGEDGLDCYRSIITEMENLLQPGGICLLEVGYTQADDVTRLVEDSGLFVNGVHADMAGIPRVVEISFGEK